MDLLAQHIEQERAIESAWRWFRRNKDAIVPLAAIVARVQARCPDADPKHIQYEIERRMKNSRTRLRGRRPHI